MANKIGPKIKEARNAAGLSQTKLAELIEGVSANDIGKAERGEKELTQAQLKQIAKATGVTQKSLLEAAADSTYGTAKKSTKASSKTTETATKKTSSSKKSTTSSTKTGTSTKKTSSSKKTSSTASDKDEWTLTATEKKLVTLYRTADSTAKKNAIAILKGEEIEEDDSDTGILGSLLGGSGATGALSSLLGGDSSKDGSGLGSILSGLLGEDDE